MFKYTAFISYSNASKRAAIDLHKRLERYVVPRALRGRTTDQTVIGKSLGVFCVDRWELSATADLEDALKTALSDSKFLIVLCTPQAAASTWVRLEIEYFKSLGRGAYILPVLIDGEPEVFHPDTSPNGAFPRDLFEARDGKIDIPLAPDFRNLAEGRGDGDEVAFLRVVAHLLGVRFPEMTQRHLVAEKQKRQFRNRVIGALALMLVLTVTGGTLAWMQKQAADQRLAQALQTAAKQVHLAKEFRPRYGIPSSVSFELFSSASEEFATIAAEAGNSPDLLLNRARYALGMADLVADVDGSARSSRSFLQTASQDIDAARAMSRRWYAPHWFHSVPAPAQILREEVNALDLMSKYSASAQTGDEALHLAQRALALSQKLDPEAGADPQDIVFSVCALADVQYTLGRRLQSEETYGACLESAEALLARQPGPNARSLFVNALIDYGMILRLNPGEVDRALELHERAMELARAAQKGAVPSNDDQLLLANAHVTYADTVNLAAGALETQLAQYQHAGRILNDLIATDLNRKDWKTLRSLALYREAGVYARQAMAHAQPSLLNASAATLSEGIDVLEPLAQRFADDIGLARTLTAFYESRAEINVLLLENGGKDSLKAMVHADLDAMVDKRLTLLETTQGQPEQRTFSRDLAQAHLVRARMGMRLEQNADAVLLEFAKARAIFQSLEGDPDFQPNVFRDLGIIEIEVARLLSGLGETDKACRHARTATDHMTKLTEASAGNVRNTQDSAYTHQQMEALCALKEQQK